MKFRVILFLAAVAAAFSCSSPKETAIAGRWSEEKANEWYATKDWPVGCVFMPSYAATGVEFWQDSTFNKELIDTELGLAEDLGFNTIRLFMNNIVWEKEHDLFMGHLEDVISMADKHGMTVLPNFFTNGGKDEYIAYGPQPQPIPGIHNGVWAPNPGKAVVNDPSKWGPVKEYLQEIIRKYKDDPRILAWCLYNEPENKYPEYNTYPLLKAVFSWAREINPSQPLTAPIWGMPGASNSRMHIQGFLFENCDIISFHAYFGPETARKMVDLMKVFNRPMLCTEWMARTRNSTFEGLLPIFKENKIGSYSYGLVAGKQQCQYPWNKVDENGQKIPWTEEPELPFHDIFKGDHSPLIPSEIDFIKSMTGASAAKSE